MPKDLTTYTLEEALTKAIAASKEKFDASVEAHFNFDLNVTKPEQSIRVTTTLPHGTGKKLKVAVFASEKVSNADLELTEADLPRIEKGELRPRVDFDVLVAEPKMMAKLAKVARVLGPAGVMPNPKSGTVAEDVKKAVEQLKKGKIELRTEQTSPLLHTILGKKSFEINQLAENFNEILSTLRANKPPKAKPEWIKSCYVCTSMGSSFGVKIEAL